MKTRELSMGEMQAVLKLRKEETSIGANAQALGTTTNAVNSLECSRK